VVISQEEAIAILKKWKDEFAHIVVVAQGPLRQTPSGMQGSEVRWGMTQNVKVSGITAPTDKGGPSGAIVEFEGPTGNLSISLDRCRFIYEDPREASSDVREEAEAASVSALSVFFPYDECFILYEMRELAPES